MKKTLGVNFSGTVAAILVASALVGTWFLASFVAETRARQTLIDTLPDVRAPPIEIRREPLPTGEDHQPAPGESSTQHDQRSARDVHFEGVLESLASRQRRESFEAIFQSNMWGCASLRSESVCWEQQTCSSHNPPGTNNECSSKVDHVTKPRCLER
jgi:hypothetical protein